MKAGIILKEVTIGELALTTGMPKIGVVLAGATREDAGGLDSQGGADFDVGRANRGVAIESISRVR